jgi:adenylyltransferase/sulfurtransferase
MTSRGGWEMTPQELHALHQKGENPVLLDVRSHDEVEAAAIAGAVHIPLDELGERVGELDPALKTVVFCHHGVRSLAATGFLRQQGFADVSSLAGGIDRWSVLIDPSVPRYG